MFRRNLSVSVCSGIYFLSGVGHVGRIHGNLGDVLLSDSKAKFPFSLKVPFSAHDNFRRGASLFIILVGNGVVRPCPERITVVSQYRVRCASALDKLHFAKAFGIGTCYIIHVDGGTDNLKGCLFRSGVLSDVWVTPLFPFCFTQLI